MLVQQWHGLLFASRLVDEHALLGASLIGWISYQSVLRFADRPLADALLVTLRDASSADD